MLESLSQNLIMLQFVMVFPYLYLPILSVGPHTGEHMLSVIDIFHSIYFL